MILSRRKIFLTGFVVSTLMILFPPWLYFDGNTSNQRSAGYHFILDSPRVKTYEQMFGFAADNMPTQFVRVRLNYIRLITQFLTVSFVSMGLDLKLESSWSSGCFMALGVLGILALILLMSSKF